MISTEMSGGLRHRTEQIALSIMAVSGVGVVLADLMGWLDSPGSSNVLPKVTLVILCTVTVFLLMEIERLKVLDKVDRQLSKLDIDAMAGELKHLHYGGAVQVHERFPEERFTRLVCDARREVTILQTWIPNLNRFQWALREAVHTRRVAVRVLLLHPTSPVAQLREEALRRDPALSPNAKANVEMCLSQMAEVAADLKGKDRLRVQVRLYNSLPSIAVYKTDQTYLISSFLHAQLAVDSPQIEVDGADTSLGQQVEHELETLWQIGAEVDLTNWRDSLRAIQL
jgi:hypothetical protein